MSADVGLRRTSRRNGLRGFSTLFHKESRAWWGTRRWWINALLWTVLLGGLTAIMLFGPNEEVLEASEAEIAQAGGVLGYTQWVALNVFFQFGVPVLAIGTVILSQDLIIGERQNGVAEWLLSKPMTRRAYILAKITAHGLPILALLVGLPSTVAYTILSLWMGTPFPLASFLSAVGATTVHTLFYFTLTLMLGTIFAHRGPILGIALGSVLGGGLIGDLIPAVFYITPWNMAKVAWVMATGQAMSAELKLTSLVATVVWSIVFVFVSLTTFEKLEV